MQWGHRSIQELGLFLEELHIEKNYFHLYVLIRFETHPANNEIRGVALSKIQ